jgi:hypothetical protein
MISVSGRRSNSEAAYAYRGARLQPPILFYMGYAVKVAAIGHRPILAAPELAKEHNT